MTRATPPPPQSMISVYAGQLCIGHVISRGKSGFEAFNASDISLGTFPTRRAAIDAIAHKVVEARR